MSFLQFPNSVVAGEVDGDRAESVDARLRVPERRDCGCGGHPPLGSPARAAQPPRRTVATAVPPRRHPHVGGGRDLSLQSGTEFNYSVSEC